MDVVLEVADTFIFDPLYAKLLPAYPAALVANATLSSIREEPTAYARPHATWHYEPATQFFSTTPSKYAYMSQWPRDDWRRQALSLYLITWYALSLSLFLSAMQLSTNMYTPCSHSNPQALRCPSLLHLRERLLLLHLRQEHLQPPAIP